MGRTSWGIQFTRINYRFVYDNHAYQKHQILDGLAESCWSMNNRFQRLDVNVVRHGVSKLIIGKELSELAILITRTRLCFPNCALKGSRSWVEKRSKNSFGWATDAALLPQFIFDNKKKQCSAVRFFSKISLTKPLVWAAKKNAHTFYQIWLNFRKCLHANCIWHAALILINNKNN